MSINRITGLASGMDTESMIQDLMKFEKMKIDSTERDKIMVEWEQEAYREITKSVQAFKSEYFDFLNSETNFRSVSAFSEYTESVQVAGEDVTYISAEGRAGVQNYNHTIGSISQLATKDKWTSNSTGIGTLSGDDFNFAIMPSNVKFNLTIDGNTKTIAFATAGIATKEDLVSVIDAQIQNEFGSDYAGVVTADATEDAIDFSLDGSDITILEADGGGNSLTWLGFESGESTTDYLEKSLFNLFRITNTDLNLMEINGVKLSDIGVTMGSTISELTKAINSSSEMDVTFHYNSTDDTFSITSNQYGSANEVEMSAMLMGHFGFTDVGDLHEEGQNAILELNGTEIVKSSNTFTVEGVQFTLNETYDGADGDIEVGIDTDTDAIKEKITNFVETYNGLVELINGKINEKRDYDYEPLTTEEKEALSEDEIENWESRAKSGLLRNDKILSKMLSDMRMALYEKVEGVDLTLNDIGIQTSAEYKRGGILVIDDEKLTQALENKYDDVVSFFTNESDKEYLDSDNVSERYRENGLASKLYDIIQDNVRTTRSDVIIPGDDAGSKGILLEKAGIENDLTDARNTLSDRIWDFETKIEELWDDYYDQENRYYRMFGNMEAALSEMQSQSSSLMAQLG